MGNPSHRLVILQPRILGKSFAAAFVIEAILVTWIGWHEHWLSHPHPTELGPTEYLEAQVFEVPKETHLVEKKSKPLVQPKKEVTLSKKPDVGKKISDTAPPLVDVVDEQNQTQSIDRYPPNHGPIPVFAPLPTIPTDLRDQEFKATLRVEFYVTAHGGVIPRLKGTTGNDELDLLTLETLKKWIFRPAEENHKPIDSKAPLTIRFSVD
jgi:outer membrane biosynthesis protein TonB